jgi:hypothetical protein
MFRAFWTDNRVWVDLHINNTSDRVSILVSDAHNSCTCLPRASNPMRRIVPSEHDKIPSLGHIVTTPHLLWLSRLDVLLMLHRFDVMQSL